MKQNIISTDYSTLRDYQHPSIQISRISECKGNGLIAIDDIPRNTIVLCEKAFIFVECPTPYIVKVEFDNIYPELTDRERSLYEELYKHPDNDIISAFNKNAYKTTPNYASDKNIGLFLVPSFMNHSCIPNTVKYFNSDYIIVRTSKDIKKGTEITSSYLYGDNYMYYEGRQKYLAKFGFECTCELCEYEQTQLYVEKELMFDQILRRKRSSEYDKDVYQEYLHFLQEADSLPFKIVDGEFEVLEWIIKSSSEGDLNSMIVLLLRELTELDVELLPHIEEFVKLLTDAKKKLSSEHFDQLKNIFINHEEYIVGSLDHIEKKYSREYKIVFENCFEQSE